ncbi:CIC11C00000001992 [Sungouiella intermedia]|uniref:CIC11C00000001992 n=1 Tax=Sungouiella intermedia TaxID=45354 RepID=A0A1L0BJZ7_9ASCO|nr:CIC11C00000001992 [[Candida] intermedia]
MLAIGDTILRALNFVFLVIALGLTGSLAASTVYQLNPQVNFGVFAAAFALLTSSFYGILAYLFAAFAWPVILAIFDFLNIIFTFAAATAIAAGIRVHSCSNQSYLNGNKIAQGESGRCRKAQASVAFLYFSFFIFLASGLFSVISVAKGGLFGGRTSAPRVGVPSVSQV